MKPTFKLFLGYLFLLLLLILVGSCSSINKTLNKIKTDPALYSAVRDYVIVDRKACVTDTVTISKDVVSYVNKDSLVHDTVSTPCPDFTRTLANGATVTSKNGLLTVDFPIKTKDKIITKTVTNNIRDKSLEDILSRRNDSLQILYTKSQSDLKISTSEVSSQKRKVVFIYIGIGLVVLVGLGIKTGILSKLIPFI